MNANTGILRSILLPLAAFDEDIATSKPSCEAQPWDRSFLNPITRINSLNSDHSTTWRIDGGEPDCGRFFAIPNFARGRPPLKIYVLLPLEQMLTNTVMRCTFDLDSIFSCPKRVVPRHSISVHLCKSLSHWSSVQPDFEAEYMSMPFGSQLVCKSLDIDPRKAEFQFHPNYKLERQWLSAVAFESKTGIGNQSLEYISWEDIRLDRQLHESINIVRIDSKSSTKRFVFKAVGEDVHLMYHELRTLLLMQEHPNIIPKPKWIVTKKCRFGGKVGICGFILEYYELGDLQQLLLRRSEEDIGFRERLKWAQEITAALLHIQSDHTEYFSDLKLNNIMAIPEITGRSDLLSTMLIDLEQRGSWFVWSPPEVCSVDYVEQLALWARQGPVRERFQRSMQKLVPSWTPSYKRRDLELAPDGYSTAWTTLSRNGKEKAQVFTLGKILWCLFECLPSPNSFLSVETFAEGICQQQKFPEFVRTPVSLRSLITSCTAGAPEWEKRSAPFVWRDGRIFYECPNEPKTWSNHTAQTIQEHIRAWWLTEIEQAEKYIAGVSSTRQFSVSGDELLPLKTQIEQRPTLLKVLSTLMDFEMESGDAAQEI